MFRAKRRTVVTMTAVASRRRSAGALAVTFLTQEERGGNASDKTKTAPSSIRPATGRSRPTSPAASLTGSSIKPVQLPRQDRRAELLGDPGARPAGAEAPPSLRS